MKTHARTTAGRLGARTKQSGHILVNGRRQRLSFGNSVTVVLITQPLLLLHLTVISRNFDSGLRDTRRHPDDHAHSKRSGVLLGGAAAPQDHDQVGEEGESRDDHQGHGSAGSHGRQDRRQLLVHRDQRWAEETSEHLYSDLDPPQAPLLGRTHERPRQRGVVPCHEPHRQPCKA